VLKDTHICDSIHFLIISFFIHELNVKKKKKKVILSHHFVGASTKPTILKKKKQYLRLINSILNQQTFKYPKSIFIKKKFSTDYTRNFEIPQKKKFIYFSLTVTYFLKRNPEIAMGHLEFQTPFK
jgi:hypothetical protein